MGPTIFSLHLILLFLSSTKESIAISICFNLLILPTNNNCLIDELISIIRFSLNIESSTPNGSTSIFLSLKKEIRNNAFF